MPIDPWNVFTASFGQVPKPCTAFVTLFDMALYFLLTYNVSAARAKHKVPAPSMTGPDAFMRIFRTQQNTAEQLVQHMPLLWIAAFAMDDVFAAALGSIWLFSRVVYAVRYYGKASRRFKGSIIGTIINVVLFLGALAGTIASF